MRTLFRKVFGPTRRELRDELSSQRIEIAKLTTRAQEGDELLSREINNLNDENDAINHARATLTFENERLDRENKDWKAENATLRELTRRFYKADGSYEVMPWNVDVVALRIDAARRLEEYKEAVGVLEKRIDEANRRYNDFVGTASVNWEELVASRRRLIEQDAEIAELKAEVNKYVDAYRVATHSGDVAREEVERLTRMLTEPALLRAESKRVGDIVTTEADLKHWAACVLARSFAHSLGDENAVEIELGNEEVGHFVVTIRRRGEQTTYEMIEEWKDKVRTLEIALEASDELEREYRARLDGLRDRFRRERKQRKATALRCEGMTHALIGLTTAVSDMTANGRFIGRSEVREHDMLFRSVERAIDEAERVLGSEPSSA